MKKPKPPERLYTANALSTLTKLDRRTTSKRLVGVVPEKQGVNGCHKYTLESAIPALVTPERAGETHRARKERLQADLLEIEHNLASEKAWPADIVTDTWSFALNTILAALDAAHEIPIEARDRFRADVHDRLTSRGSPICAPNFFIRGKK